MRRVNVVLRRWRSVRQRVSRETNMDTTGQGFPRVGYPNDTKLSYRETHANRIRGARERVDLNVNRNSTRIPNIPNLISHIHNGTTRDVSKLRGRNDSVGLRRRHEFDYVWRYNSEQLPEIRSSTR